MARLALPAEKIRRSTASADPTPGAARLGVLANWVGAAFVLGTAAFSLYLTQVSSVATAGYELERLQAERAGWLARNEQLELEIAKRHSLAWSETQAVQRLGMVRGGPPVYVVADVATSSAVAYQAAPPPVSDGKAVPRREVPSVQDGGPLTHWIDQLATWLTAAGATAGISAR